MSRISQNIRQVYNPWVLDRNGQGTVIEPNCCDEQGDVFDPEEDEQEIKQPLEEFSELKRFPSNDNFNKDDALLKTFGVQETSQNDISDVMPESEQLGVIIDSQVQNELERLSLNQNHNLENFRGDTDC